MSKTYSENALARDRDGVVWHYRSGIWIELFPGPGASETKWKVSLAEDDTLIHGERQLSPEEILVEEVRGILGDVYTFFIEDIPELLEAVQKYAESTKH